MKDNGFSQAELAKRSRISQPSIHELYHGDTKSMRSETLLAVSRALHVSPEWLASGREPSEAASEPTRYDIGISGDLTVGGRGVANEEATLYEYWITPSPELAQRIISVGIERASPSGRRKFTRHLTDYIKSDNTDADAVDGMLRALCSGD